MSNIDNIRKQCQDFVTSCASYMPQFSGRLKTHLFLHICDHLADFGPVDCYNTERQVL